MAMNPIEKIIRTTEKTFVADAEARRADAAALTKELAKARANLANVEEAPAELLSAAKRGEDVSPSALTEARTAVELAEAKVEGLTARLNAATRNVPATDADVADLLVPLFQKRLVGVPVFTTVVPAKRVIADVKGQDGPAVVLCQEAETERRDSGLIATTSVRAVFVRPSWAADIEVMQLENEARTHSIFLKVTSNTDVQGCQVINVNVTGAAEAVPFLPVVKPESVNAALQTFGAQTSNHLGEYPQPPTVRNGVYSYVGSRTRMDLEGVKVTEDIDDDGVRTTHIKFGCHIDGGNIDRDFLRAAPRSVPARGFHAGLGRLTDIAVADTASDPRDPTLSQQVALTYTSRTK